jgi:hypothetical protein
LQTDKHWSVWRGGARSGWVENKEWELEPDALLSIFLNVRLVGR